MEEVGKVEVRTVEVGTVEVRKVIKVMKGSS